MKGKSPGTANSVRQERKIESRGTGAIKKADMTLPLLLLLLLLLAVAPLAVPPFGTRSMSRSIPSSSSSSSSSSRRK